MMQNLLVDSAPKRVEHRVSKQLLFSIEVRAPILQIG
jgi:hypothetical protein